VNTRAGVVGWSVILAASLVSGKSSQPAAPGTPTYKTLIDYVEVDALVVDKDGQIVRNLTKEDFTVLDEGKRQAISTFSFVDIPVDRVDSPGRMAVPFEPDVQTNERPFEGRLYVLILDDLHIQFSRMTGVHRAARQFIERNVGVNDLIAVVSTGGRGQDSQHFTNNKRLLLGALDGLLGQSSDSRVPDNDQLDRVRRAQMTLSTLRQIAESFGSVRGRRKTMLFFSEGLDFDFATAGDGKAADVFQSFLGTVASTSRSNVTLYAIDPRGLGLVSDDALAVATLEGPRAWLNPPPNQSAYPKAKDGRFISELADQMGVSQRTLRSLAEDTGGFAAINRNDYSGVFERIVRENSSYYLLAYDAPPAKDENKLRRIEVKVTRPGSIVHARRGYLPRKATGGEPKDSRAAATRGMPADLRDALISPLPVSGLSMRVFVAPFKGPGPNASVVLVIEMRGRDLSLDGNSRLEVSFLAADVNAKVHGARNQAVSLDLQPERRLQVQESGIRLLNRMELAPGRYELRVAVRDPGNSNVGAVSYDLEVPDFLKPPISLSGLTLTSLAGAAMFTPRADEQLKDVLPAAPVAVRTFPQNDELALFAEVYDNSASTPHEVSVVASVRADNGGIVYEAEEIMDSSALDAARASFPYTARIPLYDIAPGEYVLDVEARSSVGTTLRASRRIGFTVAPGTSAAK